MTLQVELFGVPRLLVGKRRVAIETDALTLADAARALAATCPALRGTVLDPATCWLLGGYTFALGTRFTSDPSASLADQTSLLLVASQAGG